MIDLVDVDKPRDRLRAEAIRIAIRKAPAARQLRKPLETLLDAGRIINADRSHQNRQPVVERVFECVRQFGRSEEHTSELQSLMRISYAVFCLKKKKKYTQKTNSTYNHITHAYTVTRSKPQ